MSAGRDYTQGPHDFTTRTVSGSLHPAHDAPRPGDHGPDGVEAVIAAVLGEHGLSDNPSQFDSNIHSWRCEYPDHYGPCSCLADLAARLAPPERPSGAAGLRAEADAERAIRLLRIVALRTGRCTSDYLDRVLRDGLPETWPEDDAAHPEGDHDQEATP